MSTTFIEEEVKERVPDFRNDLVGQLIVRYHCPEELSNVKETSESWQFLAPATRHTQHRRFDIAASEVQWSLC